MATNYWLGRAKPVAPVLNITPGGTIGTETFTVTVNGKSISYTANGSDTVATVVDALLAAWNIADNTIPEFAEAVATDSATHLTLTGVVSGKPLEVTSAATGSATLVTTTPTAATGPNHWDDANNWSLDAAPVDTNDVIIDKPVSILYGLDQSSVTLASLTVTGRFGEAGGVIGLPVRTSTGYTEFRDTELAIGATLVSIGGGGGRGSGMIKINNGSVEVAVTTHATGTAAERGYGAFQWRGTHADNTLEMKSGNVGVALHEGHTAVCTTTVSGGSVTFGSGVTNSNTFVVSAGDVLVQSALATLTQSGGVVTHTAGAVAALNIYAGTFYYESSGVCTAAVVGGRSDPAILDLSRDSTPRTFTDLTLDAGATLNDPHQTMTVTNKIGTGAGARTVVVT